MFGIFIQIWIMLFGPGAIWFLSCKRERLATVIGLLGQIGWLVLIIYYQLWPILLTAGLYSLPWLNLLRKWRYLK